VMGNSDEIRKRLLARQEELKGSLRQHGEESLDAGNGDVQDEIDQVTTLEAKTAALQLSTREFKALEDVRAALQRLDEGSYGKCVICGEPIDEARLRAIPETRFCIRDAESAEKAEEPGSEQTFLDA
jgi:DnaK suppressor protein